jgi:glycosyltransferase involved in cell wall biosynthesis
MRVLQCVSQIAPGEHVTAAALYVSEILADHGVACQSVYLGLNDRFASILDLDPVPDDLLIIHHGSEHGFASLLKGLNCRKVLIYHGGTPARLLPTGSVARRKAAAGLGDLEHYSGVDLAIGVTPWACEVLRRRGFESPRLLALAKDVIPLAYRPFNETFHYFKSPRYQLVSVGPISPIHGQLKLVEYVRRYANAFAHPLYLALVGHFDPADPYARKVLQTIEDASLNERIVVAGQVTDFDRFGYYRAADAFVSLSEDAVLNAPALEAMAFDLPVLARSSTATADLLDGAVVLLDDDGPETLAAHLSPLFADRDRVRQILKGQRRRLATFTRSAIGAQLIDLLQPFLAASLTRDPEPADAVHRRHYILEGPRETSYSLAIVSRTLALALAQRKDNSVTLAPIGESYKFSEEGLRDNPEIAPLLKPPPFNAEASVISYRNKYPMHPAGMRGDFRLSGIFLEESQTSQAQARMFNRYLDGLLAGSTFVRKLFRDSGVRVPIALYPLGLDHLRLPSSPPLRPASRPFMFLHVSSGLARKGIEELFAAYVAAFSRRDNVELLVKTIYKHETSVLERYYAQWVEGRDDAPVVRIIFDDRLDQGEIAYLYALADAVVLPTRGEGFGYPAAEGFLYGVPVIVTAWSGQMDFCNEENSYLVDYDFELSTSHVRSHGAMWVRARAEDLAEKMRHVYAANRTAGGRAEMSQKIDNGRKAAAKLTFKGMADRVDAFAAQLESGKVERRKLKIGWVTTWNRKCGIATHSEQMVPHLPSDQFDVIILSSQEESLGPDGLNVRRCWPHHGDSLDPVIEVALEERCDIVLFQYHYAFHALDRLGEAIEKLENAGVDTYVEIHKTVPELAGARETTLASIAPSLAKATRLIVHTVDDVNRMKGYGLVDNVVKIPPGVIAPIDVSQAAIKEFLGLGKRRPVIGSYGFLWPHKGIKTLIFAFALVARKYPDAVLLLANAVKDDESRLEKEHCMHLVESFALQDSVIMVDDYLDHEESMLLNQACDLLVFPYQFTAESASGAVRPGIASLRPVLTTPSPIFDEVADLVEQAKGSSALDIAEAMERLLGDNDRRDKLFEAQKAWVDERSWEATTKRIGNMMIGLYQDRHGVIIRPPSTLAEAKSGGIASESVDKIEQTSDRDFNSGSSTTFMFADLDNGTDAEFVHKIYEIIHDRCCESVGVASKLAWLAAGGSRAELVELMLQSDEFLHSNRPIRILFEDESVNEDGPPEQFESRPRANVR